MFIISWKDYLKSFGDKKKFTAILKSEIITLIYYIEEKYNFMK